MPHNLIQFAIELYHVPDHIRKMIFNYYDESYIHVKTKEWTTDWIHCGIGVLQGCPLSCILFLAVFNLCLDLLDQHSHLEYCMKDSSIKSSVKAYADDLTLIARNPEDCQKLVNVVDDFLRWTRSVKTKPRKCRSHAMKRFVPNKKQKQEGHKIQYVVYDPKLTINGEKIAYIHNQPMRFPGKLIFKDLKDKEVRKSVRQKLTDMLKKTDKSLLNGIMKMWVYDNAILPKMTWEFTIYNLPITYIESWDATCTKYLKRWAGISRCTTNSALYRSKKKYGRHLKRLTTSVKCTQVIKHHLNKYSVDEKTQTLYKHCLQRKSKQSRWNGVRELKQRERHLILNEMCRGQTARAGLGFKKNQKLLKDMKPKNTENASLVW